LGTYLESETEVKTFQMTKDQITTLTAGIVKTDIIEEKWDGRTYWLKAKISADASEVVKSIDALRKDHEKTKELEALRRRSDELLRENERLRKELTTQSGQRNQDKIAAYNETVKALALPRYFDEWLFYWIQGNSFMESKNYNNAIDAFSKGIQLWPENNTLYVNRGNAYGKLGNYSQAIKDYDKGIELNPKDSGPYINRGNAYGELGNYRQAIEDYDRYIELDPKYATAYYRRALAYGKLGNHRQAIENYKTAAQLGLKAAQDYLRSMGISW
jgi:tetratricopeptide (TPR) repeat protein